MLFNGPTIPPLQLNPALVGTQAPTNTPDSPPPGWMSRLATMAGIAAVWAVVTVAPLYASVLVQENQTPPIPVHAAKAKAARAVVQSSWWDYQYAAPLLPKKFVSVEQIDSPPIKGRDRIAPIHLQWEPPDPASQRSKFSIPQEQIDAPQVKTKDARIIESWELGPTVPLRRLASPQAQADSPPIKIKDSRIIQSWEPDPTPQFPHKFVSVEQIDSPPIKGRDRIAPIHLQWEPPDPASQRSKFLIPVEQIDTPPVKGRFRSSLYQAWESAPSDAQATRKLVPATVVQQVDNPPVSTRLQQAQVIQASYQPLIVTPLWRGALAQDTAAVVPDNPPLRSNHRFYASIVEQWEPRPLLPVFGLVASESVDVPPPLNRTSLNVILSAWIPLPHESQRSKFSIPQERIDNPPVTRRDLSRILVAWEAEPFMPRVKLITIQSGAAGPTFKSWYRQPQENLIIGIIGPLS